MDDPNMEPKETAAVDSKKIDDFFKKDKPEKTPSKAVIIKEKPGVENVRSPWIPLAQARKTIALLTLASLALAVCAVVLAVLVFAQLNRKPWIVGYTNGKYTQLDPQGFRVSRDDVEIFLSDIIPRLYGTVNGEAPGLDMLEGGVSVNPNIIAAQRANVADSSKQLIADGISQFAIPTGIIPDTLVINRTERFVYAEVTGITMLTRPDRSTPTETQWRCLLYIIDPFNNQDDIPSAGSHYGLYLQQIIEQPPGTVNPDSPRPTTSDEQERDEQELFRQKNSMPTLNLGE